MKPYYFAGNTFEGCGHKHRTASAAMSCFRHMNEWWRNSRPRVKTGVFKLLSVHPWKVQKVYDTTTR